MGSSGGGDVEALNKILNNINVQTKKTGDHGSSNDVKLPCKLFIIWSNLTYSNQKSQLNESDRTI